MAWASNYSLHGHRMFIAFIECKISGDWRKADTLVRTTREKKDIEYLYAFNDDDCEVHLIEPDGLRRIFHFNKGSTINIDQNILSYHPGQIEEISVDEKEQAGLGKNRDRLN